MGGYGTLVHALSHPERFKALGAFSAAVQLNPEALVSGGAAATEQKPADPSIDPASLAQALADSGKAFPKAYIACGAKDFLYQANLEVEKFLDWLPRTDGYAAAGKRQI